MKKGPVKGITSRSAYDPDVERSVLGAILLDNRRLGEVAEILKADDFTFGANQTLFAAMLLMERDARAIDLVTLSDEMRGRGELETVGGQTYIGSLTDGLPQGTNVRQYARLVKAEANRRNLALLGSSAASWASQGQTPEEIIEKVEKRISEIRDEDVSRGAVHISEATKEVDPVIERLREGRGGIIGAPTGYSELDQTLAGWVSGQLVILAARPSVGKTALALEFVRRLAAAGMPTAIFSLETSRVTLVLRLACLLARVNGQAVRSGYLSGADLDRLVEARAELDKLPIWIDDSSSMRAQDFKYKIRSLAQRQKIRFAFIDYLQLLRADAENRTQEVTEVSRYLKESAKEIGQISGGTLMALSQLRRLEENRTEPRLEDLRESGQIEQDADVVMFLYNATDEEITPGQTKAYRKVLDVKKQKEGPLNRMQMVFQPRWMGFELYKYGDSEPQSEETPES
jgi:replicative DNA helicase